MEPRTRTTTTHETILRMITARSNTSMTTGFFRFNGQGVGELRPLRGNWRDLMSLDATKLASRSRDRSQAMHVDEEKLSEYPSNHMWPQILIERPQTQNAYGFGEALKHW